MIDGALLATDEAAAYLRIRTADFAHLVRVGWIEAYDRVRSRWQSRRDEQASQSLMRPWVEAMGFPQAA